MIHGNNKKTYLFTKVFTKKCNDSGLKFDKNKYNQSVHISEL